MGLRLRPSERFMLLSQVIDDVPDDAGGALLRVVAAAQFAVVRCLEGSATEVEARYAIARARDELLKAVGARSS